MSTHWSYDLLKQCCNENTTQEDVEYLKSLFEDEIGSARKMTRIKNVDDLIDCLERHDELSEDNIGPLHEIADKLSNRVLLEAVSSYSYPKCVTAYNDRYNQYREIRLAEELKTRLTLNGQTLAGGGRVTDDNPYCRHHMQPSPPPQPPAPAPTVYAQVLTDKKRAAIYKVIAQNIGKFWRSLGRELEIGQGQMDELEIQYPRDIVSRVFKLLHLFEEDETQDPKRHVLTLCRALDECRRKDLRRKVEEIMSL